MDSSSVIRVIAWPSSFHSHCFGAHPLNRRPQVGAVLTLEIPSKGHRIFFFALIFLVLW